MARERRPRPCELYLAGHTVHWIQANRSAGQPHRHGRLVAVEGNLVTVGFEDGVRHYRNHTPERLLEIVGIGGAVEVCEDYVVLRHRTDHRGAHLFSVARAEWPWIPCDDTPLTSAAPEALAERLRTHGGVVVAGPDVLNEL